MGWFDWSSTDSVLPETGLVVLDTATDEAEEFNVDDRCGGVTQGVTLDSGDTYFVSSALAAAAHRLQRLATGPCALRLQKGATQFDSGYFTDVAELTSSGLAGEAIPAGGDGLLLRVFQDELGEVVEGDATWDVTGQAAWSWARWDLESERLTPLAGLAPSTSDVLWFTLEGRVFGTETDGQYTSTTLIDLTHEGGPQPALTAPGFLHSIARIR